MAGKTLRNFVTVLLVTLAVAANGEYYDVLIAGAGTAGLVIATRLAEHNLSVAVIEPGTNVTYDPDVQTIDFVFSSYNKSINWVYPALTEPPLTPRNLSYRAGKAWGGTSAVNGMVYILGDSAQYDAWEKLGNHGWNWKSLFHYAKYQTTFTKPTSAQTALGITYTADDQGYHGPLQIGYALIANSSFYQMARQTWRTLGLDAIKDLNGGKTRGFSSAPQTLDADTATRSDSAEAYYHPIRDWPNIKILQGTVKRITWANTTGRAKADGFEYFDASGKLVTMKANKEVVVSASAFRSPLILEGSGIGNPSILQKLGIPVKVALPGVGESLQDHNIIGNTYSITQNITGRTPWATMPTAEDVFGDDYASIKANTTSQVNAWAKKVASLTCGGVSTSAVEKRFRIQHDLIFKDNVTIAELFPGPTDSGIFAQYWITMPFSWGRVHLQAADKIDMPQIMPQLFTTDFDRQMLTAVGRLSYKAYSTPPLSDLIASNLSPGYETLPLNATDAQWATYLDANAANALHCIGTCAMLPEALGGVVDANAKVHGTANVRVVDASIIPMQVTGHTSAPLYAVAEKAAANIIASMDS